MGKKDKKWKREKHTGSYIIMQNYPVMGKMAREKQMKKRTIQSNQANSECDNFLRTNNPVS